MKRHGPTPALPPSNFSPLFAAYNNIEEIHAWHMTDNTINLYSVHLNPTLWVWSTGFFKPSFNQSLYTAYKMIAIRPTSYGQSPIITWIAANHQEVIRFTCGPAESCSMVGQPTPLPIPPSSNFSIQSIQQYTDFFDAAHQVLIHPGGAIHIQLTQTEIKVIDSLSWMNEAWFNTFPVDRVSGVIHTFSNINNQTRGRLVVSLAPHTNVTGVGMVLNANFDSQGHALNQVTMMPQAAQNFGAHERKTSDGLVYYWLIEQSIPNVSENAFILSSGGSPQDPLQHAAAKFEHDVHWSKDVFLFNKAHTKPTSSLNVGLVIAGNDARQPARNEVGFRLWSPEYAYGQGYPEVNLGQSSPVKGFGMPILASNVFPEFRGSYASMAALGYNGWYMIFLQWDITPKGHQASAKAQQRPVFVSEDFNKKRFASNCRQSNCDIDEPGDCAIGKCWGRGAFGGFECCQHPPV